MGKEIKAILFDSGKVLNGPATGDWFISPNFYHYVDQKSFTSISKHQRDIAFSKAAEYISKQDFIHTEEEEYQHFLQYYSTFFAHIPELAIQPGQIEGIARDLVYNPDKYVFYGDVGEVLPRLAEGYKLAIVSDAWPSLENVYKKAGYRDYFSSFVISSKLGIVKPHALMYQKALEELEVTAHQAVFVDDNRRNCDGAEELGIRSFLLCRDFKSYLFNKLTCKHHAVVRNLKDLENHLL